MCVFGHLHDKDTWLYRIKTGKEKIEIEQTEEAAEILAPEETDRVKTQKRLWYKLWWVKLLFGALVLGVLIFAALGLIKKTGESDVLHLSEMEEEKNLDLTSSEYFYWDDDR